MTAKLRAEKAYGPQNAGLHSVIYLDMEKFIWANFLAEFII